MGHTNRPTFTLQQSAAIESAQNGVDRIFWERLEALQAEMPYAEANSRRVTPRPPAPKQPSKLLMTIADYARNLFIAEGNLYEDGPYLKNWHESLKDRIIDRIAQMIDHLEQQGAARGFSLMYHGVEPEQMREAAESEMDGVIAARLAMPPAPPKTGRASLTGKQAIALASAGVDIASGSPLLVALHEQSNRAIEQQQISPTPQSTQPEPQGEAKRRAKLLSDYRSATGASNRKIYEAQNSGIHKPEFYEWLKGNLAASSRTTKTFEAFLVAKRRPIPRKPTS
jgi:hypothetical protein